MNVLINGPFRQLPILILFTIVIPFGLAFGDENRTVNLSTLNWSPYTGEKLPRSGAVSSIISQAFQSENHKSVFSIWSWKTAIDKAAEAEDGIVGYFPGYHCRHHPTVEFIASNEISQAILGFAFRKDKRLGKWSKLSELSDRKIGYVKGYFSTDEFEALEKSGRLNVVRTDSDVDTLRMLAEGTIDVALIDELVFEYILRTRPELSSHRKKMYFHSKPIDVKSLFLCIRKSANGEKLKDIFNSGLQNLDAEHLINEYLMDVF
jgi:polar amino acid transport system substrate-binding protein